MLRTIRRVVAFLCFLLITLLFLDFTGTLHGWFGWLAKIQFLPALLALNVGIVLALVVLTLLFGRIYCSVICPLGVFQDLIAWVAGKRKKRRYTYSPALSWLRYGMLGLFVAAFLAGIGSLVALLAPYSAYGRIASGFFAPLYQWGNNLLAYLAERTDSYAFYSVDVWMKSLITFAIALVTLVLLFILAWKNGRTYCNTLCPVGTVLGFLSRFSLFRITMDTASCNQCGLCARNCKSACIDYTHYRVDLSRCVSCFDCIGVCRQHAISYTPIHKKRAEETPDHKEITGVSRREAMLTVAGMALTGALKGQEKKIEEVEKKRDGGMAPIIDRKEPARMTPVVPPGSLSARNMANHCTGCQLCVSACPNHLLSPSADLLKWMQPAMSYERGYCRPECVKCAEVCPAGAIRPITIADKSAIQIGHAVWIKDNCIVHRDGVQCDNCFRHCPVSAIQMVASRPEIPESLKIPVVDIERCIGCGACEHLCPSRPYSAIYVEGHAMHRTI